MIRTHRVILSQFVGQKRQVVDCAAVIGIYSVPFRPSHQKLQEFYPVANLHKIHRALMLAELETLMAQEGLMVNLVVTAVVAKPVDAVGYRLRCVIVVRVYFSVFDVFYGAAVEVVRCAPRGRHERIDDTFDALIVDKHVEIVLFRERVRVDVHVQTARDVDFRFGLAQYGAHGTQLLESASAAQDGRHQFGRVLDAHRRVGHEFEPVAQVVVVVALRLVLAEVVRPRPSAELALVEPTFYLYAKGIPQLTISEHFSWLNADNGLWHRLLYIRLLKRPATWSTLSWLRRWRWQSFWLSMSIILPHPFHLAAQDAELNESPFFIAVTLLRPHDAPHLVVECSTVSCRSRQCFCLTNIGRNYLSACPLRLAQRLRRLCISVILHQPTNFCRSEAEPYERLLLLAVAALRIHNALYLFVKCHGFGFCASGFRRWLVRLPFTDMQNYFGVVPNNGTTPKKDSNII